MREIKRIVCHHTDSKPETTPDEIRRWHKDRGWSDIGYHWVLYRAADDWDIERGRPESRTGSHAKGSNADSLGVVVAGDYTKGPLPESAEIMLCAFIASKCREFGLSAADVFGHSEVMRPGYTQCPGYDMGKIRARVGGYLAGKLV